MDLMLADRVAIVTGGSKGIGRAIVDEFVREGVRVAFCARTEAHVVQAAEAWGHDKVRGSVVDVGDPESLRAWVTQSAEQFGGIDIVVSNVSAASDSWPDLTKIDLMAAVTLVDAALPFLKLSGAASGVAIVSRAAYTGEGPYGAIKTALISYFKSLSEKYATDGIRFNTIAPGDIYFTGGVWDRIEHSDPDEWHTAQERNRLGRLGSPEEVARVVAFVSSPAASFVSGANVRVDGAGSRSTQF